MESYSPVGSSTAKCIVSKQTVNPTKRDKQMAVNSMMSPMTLVNMIRRNLTLSWNLMK